MAWASLPDDRKSSDYEDLVSVLSLSLTANEYAIPRGVWSVCSGLASEWLFCLMECYDAWVLVGFH